MASSLRSVSPRLPENPGGMASESPGNVRAVALVREDHALHIEFSPGEQAHIDDGLHRSSAVDKRPAAQKCLTQPRVNAKQPGHVEPQPVSEGPRHRFRRNTPKSGRVQQQEAQPQQRVHAQQQGKAAQQ